MISSVLFCAWLGGFSKIVEVKDGSSIIEPTSIDVPGEGRLLTIEEVGEVLGGE
jgi:hypothetical protein